MYVTYLTAAETLLMTNLMDFIQILIDTPATSACAALDDIRHLVMKYRIPVAESALQVYHSAIVTIPSCQLWRELACYEEKVPVLVSPRSEDWDSPVQVLEGHNGPVYSVAFLPDGKHIASISDDRTVRVWDAITGTLRHTLTDHDGEVYSVAFSPDGKHIASGSLDCTVGVWDTTTGTLRHTLTGHNGSVNSVAFSPDGRYIASGSRDRTVRVWDAATSKLRRTLTGHNGSVNSVAFSSSGTRIISGSDDCTVRVWDTTTGMFRLTLTGHDGWVSSVIFSPDGKCIASGSRDRTVRVWDAITGTLRHILTSHDGSVKSVSFSPDNKYIVSYSLDGTVTIWDANSGKRCNDIDGGSASSGDTDLTQSLISSDPTFAPNRLPAGDSGDAGWPLFKLEQETGWISRRKWGDTWRRVCWLPVEIRADGKLAHFGQRVVVGARSGAVAILDFSRVN
jgi:WD40 repeat protein